MLREIDATLQTKGGPFHRWFTDEYFDFHLWKDASGRVVRWQLVYGKGGSTGAFEWREGGPLNHFHVDEGETPGRPKASPLLTPADAPLVQEVLRRFQAAAAGLPPSLRAPVLSQFPA